MAVGLVFAVLTFPLVRPVLEWWLPDSAWVNGEWVKTRESLAGTVQEFTRWCQRTAFGWRMALHG